MTNAMNQVHVNVLLSDSGEIQRVLYLLEVFLSYLVVKETPRNKNSPLYKINPFMLTVFDFCSTDSCKRAAM